jgi:hypothetical protein
MSYQDQDINSHKEKIQQIENEMKSDEKTSHTYMKKRQIHEKHQRHLKEEVYLECRR